MKIKQEHLEAMRAAIQPLDTAHWRDVYMNAGLTNQRYRWDLMHKSGFMAANCSDLYRYLNDEHIDTALRSIVTRFGAHT